jgi:hypothetical protein
MNKSHDQDGSNFEVLADQALGAMRRHAGELRITGVAVVAYSKGEVIESWISKMLVIGRLAGLPSEKDPAGANYLGIAYTKAAEMADTLKDSGSNIRPPKKGEYGWQGGAVIKSRTGYCFASFSGGPSADDLKVANTGLEILAKIL